MLIQLTFGIAGKLSVEDNEPARSKELQFALRFGAQWLVFKSPDAAETISSERVDRRQREYGPVDVCNDAFSLRALEDQLTRRFETAPDEGRRGSSAKAALCDQRSGAIGCGNIMANEALHLAGVDPQAPARSLGRAEAVRLAYWVRAFAMRWYRGPNSTVKANRLIDDRKPVDGCGECGGPVTQSFCEAMGRDVRGFACVQCLARLAQQPRPMAIPPDELAGRTDRRDLAALAIWPRPRAKAAAPSTPTACVLLNNHTCSTPREKLQRIHMFNCKWRFQYKCASKGCDAKAHADVVLQPWPTCNCDPAKVAYGSGACRVGRYSTGAQAGELWYSCRHDAKCPKSCGMGRRSLASSGLSAAARARLTEDFKVINSRTMGTYHDCCKKAMRRPKRG
mmetsp:Transcript_17093/g.51005  ORF Transcript_17093/g.51005 Transcript_17093/m.51005 type:complete len:395 (+) Transcript_17093:1-1185(+)